MKILIVEDNIERFAWFDNKFKGHEIVWITSRRGADLLENITDYDYIFLDYDLDITDRTGYTGLDFVKKFRSNLNHAWVCIHSRNLLGSHEMKKLIPNAVVIPFPMLKELQICEEILK